jgi:hypothetical protein
MPASASLEIYGIQEALAEINKVDRLLRRQITKDIQAGAGNKLVTAARSFIPAKAPLSRMVNGNMIKGRDGTGWSRDRVIRGIRTVVGKRGQRARTVKFSNGRTADFKATQYQLLALQQRDVAGAIWDHAGIRGGGQFVANLIAEGEHVGPKEAPRAMEPAALSMETTVQAEMQQIVERVMTIVNRNLITTRTR